jgi:hypothetical protein
MAVAVTMPPRLFNSIRKTPACVTVKASISFTEPWSAMNSKLE